MHTVSAGRGRKHYTKAESVSRAVKGQKYDYLDNWLVDFRVFFRAATTKYFPYLIIDYFQDHSFSCLHCKLSENSENVSQTGFPKAHDILKWLVLSTTQRHSLYCHRGIIKPVHLYHLRSLNQIILWLDCMLFFFRCFVNSFGHQKITQHILFDICCRSLHMQIPISITHCVMSRLTCKWGQMNILLSHLSIRIFGAFYSPQRFAPPCLLKNILW